MVEHIFDHVPEIAFFIKDLHGRYVAVNQSLVERCGLKPNNQLLGRTVPRFFPKDFANLYSEQDQKVLRTGQPIVDRLDMHWYTHRKPGWCLTTKLPIFAQKRASLGSLASPGTCKRPDGVSPSLQGWSRRWIP